MSGQYGSDYFDQGYQGNDDSHDDDFALPSHNRTQYVHDEYDPEHDHDDLPPPPPPPGEDDSDDEFMIHPQHPSMPHQPGLPLPEAPETSSEEYYPNDYHEKTKSNLFAEDASDDGYRYQQNPFEIRPDGDNVTYEDDSEGESDDDEFYPLPLHGVHGQSKGSMSSSSTRMSGSVGTDMPSQPATDLMSEDELMELCSYRDKSMSISQSTAPSALIRSPLRTSFSNVGASPLLRSQGGDLFRSPSELNYSTSQDHGTGNFDGTSSMYGITYVGGPPEGHQYFSNANHQEHLNYIGTLSPIDVEKLHTLKKPALPDDKLYTRRVKFNGRDYAATSTNIPRSPYLEYVPHKDLDGSFKEDELLFHGSVVTSVEESLRQARAGHNAFKRLLKFIDGYCVNETKSINDQTQFIASQAHKSGHSNYGSNITGEALQQTRKYELYIARHCDRKSETYDYMSRTQHTFVRMLNSFEQHTAIRRQLIGQIRKTCYMPYRAQVDLIDHKITKVANDYKRMNTEKARVLGEIKKLCNECQSYLKQARIALGIDDPNKDVVEETKKEEKRSFFSSKMKQLKHKAQVIVAGDPRKLCDQFAQTATDYKRAVENGNAYIQTYGQDCVKLHTTLAIIESERITFMNKCMSDLSQIFFNSLDPMGKLYAEWMFSSFEFDPQFDFQTYLRAHKREHILSPEPLEIYRLPCSPEDIRNQKLDVNPLSVFHVTLDHCMQLQQDDHPELTVPRILVVLFAKLRELGGLTSEGIFRISYHHEGLAALRKSFENGEYDCPIDTPNAAAALFKEWLRELSDSLIPMELYSTYLSTMKSSSSSPTHAVGGGAASPSMVAQPAPAAPLTIPTSPTNRSTKSTMVGNTKIEIEKDIIMDLYQQLPEINRNVIKEIAILCTEISHPINQAKNRMTIENLAIVFAPSFFRNPSDDPNEILVNSKNEVKLTTAILAYVGQTYANVRVLDEEYAVLHPHDSEDAGYSPTPTPMNHNHNGKQSFFAATPPQPHSTPHISNAGGGNAPQQHQFSTPTAAQSMGMGSSHGSAAGPAPPFRPSVYSRPVPPRPELPPRKNTVFTTNLGTTSPQPPPRP